MFKGVFAIATVLVAATTALATNVHTQVSLEAQSQLSPCPGDTRGDKRCNKDATHRVCAKIGDQGTSFFQFTKQNNWCGTSGKYEGDHGNDIRCPEEHPTWCICMWATADWIENEGCGDSVAFDCAATDICFMKTQYEDAQRNLTEAKNCLKTKCPTQWGNCGS